MKNSIFLLFLFTIYNGITDATYLPKQIATVNVPKPGFAYFVPSTLNNTYHLAISSFNGVPYSSDYIFYFSNFSQNYSTPYTQLNNKNLLWPNEASHTDLTLLTKSIDPYGGLIAPGGFLVPTKENGGIFYYPFTSKDKSNITLSAPYELSLASQGKVKWFYHRVKLVDVSGDGKLDLLTCRSYKPIVGSTLVQLVAFILDEESLVYVEKVILNDVCDIFFDVADLDHDGRVEIIASGFFIEKLNIIYSDDPKNSFLNGNVKIKTIDPSGGKLFDVKITQLDNSGNLELLVTNHQGNKDLIKGSIYVYQLVGLNVRNGTWSRNVVYDNFPVLKSGINQAAPGGAKAFYPNLREQNSSRPYLLVSGDGAEYAYLFEPTQSGQLSYKLVWTQLYKGFTVGGTSVADLNGDGFSEVIIPIYESNTCYVYTLKN